MSNVMSRPTCRKRQIGAWAWLPFPVSPEGGSGSALAPTTRRAHQPRVARAGRETRPGRRTRHPRSRSTRRGTATRSGPSARVEAGEHASTDSGGHRVENEGTEEERRYIRNLTRGEKIVTLAGVVCPVP